MAKPKKARGVAKKKGKVAKESSKTEGGASISDETIENQVDNVKVKPHLTNINETDESQSISEGENGMQQNSNATDMSSLIVCSPDYPQVDLLSSVSESEEEQQPPPKQPLTRKNMRTKPVASSAAAPKSAAMPAQEVKEKQRKVAAKASSKEIAPQTQSDTGEEVPKKGHSMTKRKLAMPAHEVKEKQTKVAAKAASKEIAPVRNQTAKQNMNKMAESPKSKATKVKKITVTASKEKSAMNESKSTASKVTTKSNPRLTFVSSTIAQAQDKAKRDKMKIADKVIVAIHALGEKDGSTIKKIVKYIVDHHEVDKNTIDKRVKAHLRKFYDEKNIVQKKNTIYNVNRKFRLKSNKYQKMYTNKYDGDTETCEDDEDVE